MLCLLSAACPLCRGDEPEVDAERRVVATQARRTRRLPEEDEQGEIDRETHAG